MGIKKLSRNTFRISAVWASLLVLLFSAVISNGPVAADTTPTPTPLSGFDQSCIINNCPQDVPSGGSGQDCTASIDDTSSSGDTKTSSSSNQDYAGNPILNQAQLAAVAQNTPTYQQAAQQVGIPWQMLAAIHYRETGLKLYNPGNGQGIYQNTAGGFTPGEHITPADFLAQSITAAKFIKNSVSSNYSADQNLTATTTDANTIKDTFFTYNGRASVYEQQAASLGYSATSQGFEGSPYVMNYADKQRDPTVDTTGWGQIKTDGGGISYPADWWQFGAFLVYADVAGLAITSSCGGGAVQCSGSSASAGLSSTRQSIVCLAQQELAAWQPGGKYQPGDGSYTKYTQGRSEEWCADFASWIYNQAGDPIGSGKDGNVSYVPDLVTDAKNSNGKFTYHALGDGYTPQPGDLAIHGSGHVNIVISTSGGKVTMIGGDQGGKEAGNGFENLTVSEYTASSPASDDPPITGYVSPN